MLAQTLKDIGGRDSSTSSLPKEFKKIKENFQRAKDEGRTILLENNEFRSAYSVTLKLHYIGDRWCMGYARYLHLGKEVRVPYTIHYSDVFSSDTPNSAAKNMTIIFKGDNPFGTRYREGAGEN